MVAVLQQELRNPSDDFEGFPSPYTVSEAVQSRLMAALREVGDAGALAATYAAFATDAQMEKRLAMAMAELVPQDAPMPAVQLAPRVADLVLNDPDAFIRSKAAAALGRLAHAHPHLRSDVAQVLAQALKDPAWRVDGTDTGGLADEDRRFRLVYLEAAGSLRRLGYTVAGERVVGLQLVAPQEREATAHRATPNASTVAQSANGRWIVARDAFTRLGYTVTWDPSARALLAVRGKERVCVVVGRTTAFVNGRPTRLAAPPRLVEGRLQVPASALQVAAGSAPRQGVAPR